MSKEKFEPTDSELEALSKFLQDFEKQTLFETGVGKISGGYAIAGYFNYDENYYDVELKWGVQNDVEDNSHRENFKVNRKTLTIED